MQYWLLILNDYLYLNITMKKFVNLDESIILTVLLIIWFYSLLVRHTSQYY
jgi:hypothetical protein